MMIKQASSFSPLWNVSTEYKVMSVSQGRGRSVAQHLPSTQIALGSIPTAQRKKNHSTSRKQLRDLKWSLFQLLCPVMQGGKGPYRAVTQQNAHGPRHLGVNSADRAWSISKISLGGLAKPKVGPEFNQRMTSSGKSFKCHCLEKNGWLRVIYSEKGQRQENSSIFRISDVWLLISFDSMYGWSFFRRKKGNIIPKIEFHLVSWNKKWSE